MGVWCTAALIYICSKMFEQHATLTEIRAVQDAAEGWKETADLLIARDRPGLLYVLQELQQFPEASRDFRTGRALEKAGGRFHESLDENEKTAVRKVIQLGRAAITDYLDGRRQSFGPDGAAFLDLAVRILERYSKDNIYPYLEEPKFISAFTKAAAGEDVPDDVGLYLRTNFDEAAERIDRCIAGQAFELYPEERQLFALAAEQCLKQPTEDDASNYLEMAARGLKKIAGETIAEPTAADKRVLRALLEDTDYEGTLPAGKLREWMAATEAVEFAAEEKEQLLQAADVFFQRYEAARVRLSEIVVRFAESLRDAGKRFVIYPAYDDEETRERSSALDVVFALWKKIDDKVMMVDMVESSGSENEKVRTNMRKALAAIGEPAVATLIRGAQREKIDQALAAQTKSRTKMERLRELNHTNKITRLSCIRALGSIGGTQAELALKPLVDNEDPDIAASAQESLRRLQ